MSEIQAGEWHAPQSLSGADWRRAQWALLGALAALWALHEVQSALPEAPGEPWLLAWWRLAVQHPWRLGSALTLLLWSVARGRPVTSGSGKESPFEVSSQSPSPGIVAPPAGTPAPRSPWPKP